MNDAKEPAHLNFWRRLAHNRLLDVGAVVIALIGLVRVARILPGRLVESDFTHYYVSSRLLLAGQNPYYTSLQPLCEQLGFVFSPDIPIAGYPPTFLWLFAPLAMLPPRLAFTIWVMVQVGSLWVILWWARRLLGPRLSARGWWFVCAATVASPTIYFHFYYSQIQLMLAAITLLAYAGHRAGKQTIACLAVTLAGLIKFYPFLLVPWFIWRSEGGWRQRARRAGLSVACGIVTVGLTGPALWSDFFRQGMPMAVSGEINRTSHYSIPALVTNLGYASAGFAPSAAAARLWWGMGTAAGLLGVALACALCWRSPKDIEAEFCLLTIAMLAGTVTVQVHYFVWLVFPLAAAAVRIPRQPTTAAVWLFGLSLVLLNYLAAWESPFLDRHILLKILCNNMPLYGLLALAFYFVLTLIAAGAYAERGQRE